MLEMPISKDLFAALVVYLQDSNIFKRCDGLTLRYCSRFLKKHGHLSPEAVEKTCAFFKNNGGFCDCEVLFNVVPSVFPDKDEFLKYVEPIQTKLNKRKAELKKDSRLFAKMPRLIRISIGEKKYFALRKELVRYLKDVSNKKINAQKKLIAENNGWTLEQVENSKVFTDFTDKQNGAIKEAKLLWANNPTVVMTYDENNDWFVPLTAENEEKAKHTSFQASFLIGVMGWRSMKEHPIYMIARDDNASDGCSYYVVRSKTLSRQNKFTKQNVATPQEAVAAVEKYYADRKAREDKARENAAQWLESHPKAKERIFSLAKQKRLKMITAITNAYSDLSDGVRPSHIKALVRG